MLPELLVRERDRVECTTFMGLLPEIDHAWMSVDNVLFLWNYYTQDITQFRKLQQVRVCGLVPSSSIVCWRFPPVSKISPCPSLKLLPHERNAHPVGDKQHTV